MIERIRGSCRVPRHCVSLLREPLGRVKTKRLLGRERKYQLGGTKQAEPKTKEGLG